MKICKKCELDKELEEFHKSSRQKDGYNYYCKKCMRNANKKAWNEHGYKRVERMREYGRENQARHTETSRIWQNKKYKEDPEYRIKDILRTRFYFAVNKEDKFDSVINLIGCSPSKVKEYLSKDFKKEWNWENQGELWEIDHIIPLSKFDLTNPEEQRKAFHYTNLQPMWKTSQIAEQYGYNEIGNRNKLNKIL